jgi:hypothetical protein
MGGHDGKVSLTLSGVTSTSGTPMVRLNAR